MFEGGSQIHFLAVDLRVFRYDPTCQPSAFRLQQTIDVLDSRNVCIPRLAFWVHLPRYGNRKSSLKPTKMCKRLHKGSSRTGALASLNLTRASRRRKLRILGMGRKAQKNDSLPGSLDMLILRTLSRRDLHGYGIVQFIQQWSDNELLVEEGSLYPALQRLELNGWIDGVWGVTSNNRRARIYKITAAGRKQLAVETRKYAKLTLAIARVMGAE